MTFYDSILFVSLVVTFKICANQVELLHLSVFIYLASDVDDVITNSSGVGCLFIICFVFASYVQIIYLKQVAGAKLASLFSLFFFYIARGLQNRGHREKYSHLLRAR